MPSNEARAPRGFPHKIATLCDLRDAQGRVLLIHRHKPPNQDLYSPIGGKLDLASGESPLMSARREILEEAQIDVPASKLRLAGLISEHGYGGETNWLMFWYRAIDPVDVPLRTFREGRLEWRELSELPSEIDGPPGALPMPETDRRVIWPLVLAHDGGFFSVHIDCTRDQMTWTIEESIPALRST